MGQYYEAVNPRKREYLYPHDFDNGAKLAQHSYIRNAFLDAVEHLLSSGGGWHGDPLVWAGDYGDEGMFLENERPFITGSNGKKIKTKDLNLYEIAQSEFERLTTDSIPNPNSPLGNYIVNHTKREYVRKDSCPKDEDGRSVHPLSILTSSGNGKGGGDYCGTSMNLVGTWAGDCVSIECEAPEKYTEIHPDFLLGQHLLELIVGDEDVPLHDLPEKIDEICEKSGEDDVVRGARILLALSADDSIPLPKETIERLHKTLSNIRHPNTAWKALKLASFSWRLLGLSTKRFFANLSNEWVQNRKRPLFALTDGNENSFILNRLRKLILENDIETILMFTECCLNICDECCTDENNIDRLRKIDSKTIDTALSMVNGNIESEPLR